MSTSVHTESNIFAISDTGLVRKNNEDKLLVASSLSKRNFSHQAGYHETGLKSTLCVVADGMGGENAGEIASDIAVKKIYDHLYSGIRSGRKDSQILKLLQDAQLAAHQAILRHANSHNDCLGMGTTVVLSLIYNKQLFLGWTGDSRAYLYRKKSIGTESEGEYSIYRNGNLELLTNDHSVVWRQVIDGNLLPDQARNSPMSNIVTQVLGDPLHIPQPEARSVELIEGDIILLCSDGLNGMVSDELINQIIESKINHSLKEIAEELLLKAKIAGGKDNISFVLLSYKPSLDSSVTSRLFIKDKRLNMTWVLLVLLVLTSSGIAVIFDLLDIVDLTANWNRLIENVQIFTKLGQDKLTQPGSLLLNTALKDSVINDTLLSGQNTIDTCQQMILQDSLVMDTIQLLNKDKQE